MGPDGGGGGKKRVDWLFHYAWLIRELGITHGRTKITVLETLAAEMKSRGGSSSDSATPMNISYVLGVSAAAIRSPGLRPFCCVARPLELRCPSAALFTRRLVLMAGESIGGAGVSSYGG